MSDTIQLGHGGGGRLSRALIDEEILSRFGEGPLRSLPDGAVLPVGAAQIVFSTDSFVVQPLVFPGGSIGHLAVHGTVNDIAVSGGTPRWLSLGLIIEEGLPLSTLRRILDDIKQAAQQCGVTIATGDTKVVAKGQADGLYINTAGVGELLPGFRLDPERIQDGDVVLASGPLGDHGMAIMAAREGIAVDNPPQSDSAPVHRLVSACQPYAEHVHFMRDPTRGGAAAVLNEIVEQKPWGIVLDEQRLPFHPAARAIAEVLGFDLLHVASEGRLLMVCAAQVADSILAHWHTMEEGRQACAIGRVSKDAGRVILETAIGGRRMVDVPQGELLPRIC